ncbi:MAG: bifunctional 4-hydroxy-2-oxoglutarate aldolase/2-dehydro-3-deoxy-phosphogluconate aldolase [Chitinophagaceae bacterium]|nr:bifunctional 4-hydroxy-2-oxoglutarate aldolase/2-dehydro-3-deoxy-phosphogluconate aldolase [Chitinophagaceae bacterium]MCA6454305.1 bifunctional 4-hydroxy-2-oxoglutarate aldolase/2-dehydro-3-deoxy-phosphogluconate aldolase [Chitinophagaceae bacterium]MCA6455418.1 bifunctional 4-hydroxy-2-oxoglutarate aldolase/2-dehydro-3-deoxy-phosphogluconate aldolase [Chitinophagaceae bacterium]MCA6458290.1 bifunctional 4-hydroxy-2-oxoglutarate aldolase/2-dehydro-3-deoxy-phosphogluconate aldolase [Chitinoph
MEKKETILSLIPQQGILPLYFYKDTGVSIEVLKALYSAGIRAVEYTNRGEAALQNFKEMRKVCDSELKGMYLGIGTIKNGEMAQTFIDAGTDYIICPGLIESVAAVADKNRMLWVPGCMTPTEIIRAETLGARMIKLFPGNILGPGFMSAIKELFPGLSFMPTGGVELDKDNISAWFKAGVCAVGMGSKLITKQLLEAKDYAQITKDTEKVLAIIQSIKS